MSLRKGKILMMFGSHSSGLGQLLVDDERFGRIAVLCQNAPTVRALDAAFGNVIGEGHTFRNDALREREIYYTLGDWGILESFIPVEKAPPEVVEKYESGG